VFGQTEASKAASDRLMRLQWATGVPRMPDGTHGGCQRSLRKVMTRKRLLVGGLAFRPEAAALDDHSLDMAHQSIDHGCGHWAPNPDGWWL
jgi:hypothetical protein